MGGIGKIFDREGGFIEKGTLISRKMVVGQFITEYSLVLNSVVLCWRLNFNSFCTPLPMTLMFHQGYDCLKICLD